MAMRSPIRLPTVVGYVLIGTGVGILLACQMFKLHDIEVQETSLYGACVSLR